MKVQTSLHFKEKHLFTFVLIKIVTFYITFPYYRCLNIGIE